MKRARATKSLASAQENRTREPSRVIPRNLKIGKTQLINPGSKGLHKHAGRWLKEPKPEHAIVLRATEISNRAFRRVVNVHEVVAALTDKEKKKLKRTYSRDLSSAVATVLGLLLRRGVVFSLGKFGTRRYYGVASAIAPANARLPTHESRRRRVLEIVRRTVIEMKRAVRNADVLEYAVRSFETEDLTSALITRDILNLKETGELRVVSSVRGDGKGINLYLPADFDPNDYVLSVPPTWLEEVARTFTELWGERASQAAAEGRRPRPLSTGEIRARLRASSLYPENVADPMTIINAMQQLAKTREPLVRKLKRLGQKAILWIPADFTDADVDAGDTYANDAERAREAVRRAVSALARPVTLHDVQHQIELDPCLRPTGTSRLMSVLSEAARERIASGKNGGRRKRVTQHIHRVGKVAEVSYYSTSKTQEVEVFIQFKNLELRWAAMRISEELWALRRASLPTLAIGRAMLALTETVGIMGSLDKLRTGGNLSGEQRQAADQLFNQMIEAADFARGWLKEHAKEGHCLPRSVNTAVPGWTADELLEVIRPLYPRAQNLRNNSKIIVLMGDAIRRIPNPHYVNRFSLNQHMASEYLFDRTDTLIYAAKEWGGYECCLQATLAGNELGHLRDPRFILPALDDRDFNARLAAVACLAFVPTDVSKERLHCVAISDRDPGVRQSALWAYGFSGAAGAQVMLTSRSKEDNDVRVRAFAHELLQVSHDSWWSL